MLDLLRRQRGKSPSDPGGPDDAPIRSHIFPKFLKRLSAKERPSVLDLGRLSGGNIEIFARLGCRVQVDDLVATSAEPEGPAEPTDSAPLPAVSEVSGGAAPRPEAAATTATAPPSQPRPPDAAPESSPARPGARPSRRIVLPPRTFARQGSSAPKASGAPAESYRTPLQRAFSYADETFDALVAWDLFNYYDPESSRRVAAEVARILKPGGLVFAYFHSRAQGTAEAPHRFRIVDETTLAVDPGGSQPLRRHVLQNRDIEKLFAGLRIVELYFLKNGLREMLLEKTPAGSTALSPGRPRPRFRIE